MFYNSVKNEEFEEKNEKRGEEDREKMNRN